VLFQPIDQPLYAKPRHNYRYTSAEIN
jgi:hypothetical protein